MTTHLDPVVFGVGFDTWKPALPRSAAVSATLPVLQLLPGLPVVAEQAE